MEIIKIKDNIFKIVAENGSYQLEAKSKSDAESKYNILVINSLKSNLINQAKSEVSKRLQATDYKVTRHQGQSYLVQNDELESTSLTDEEYKALELERQSIRDWSNAKEIEINNATTIEELKNIDTNYENARI